MITYQYNSAKLNERPLDPNVAYMLAETDAVEPYHLVLEDRPLVVFHIVPRADDTEAHPERYPDGLNNGNFGTISKSRLQELMTASGIKGVVDGPHTINGSASINIQVKNSKDRHDMEVQKNWAGDDAHENARPASVLVMLRRYVLTQEQYTDVLNTGATQNPQCILSAEMKGNSSASIARQFPENQEVTVTLNLSGNGLGDTGRIVARVDGKQIVLQPQDTSKKQFVYTTTMAYQKKVTFSVQWWQSWNNQWSADCGYDDSVSITMTPEGTPVDEVPTQVTQFTDAQWAKIRQHPDDAYGGREATLTAANGWHTQWSQLESTGADANGNKLYYIYYIVEGKVPSYTTSGITYTIDPNASKTTGTVTATLTNVYRRRTSTAKSASTCPRNGTRRMAQSTRLPRNSAAYRSRSTRRAGITSTTRGRRAARNAATRSRWQKRTNGAPSSRGWKPTRSPWKTALSKTPTPTPTASGN